MSGTVMDMKLFAGLALAPLVLVLFLQAGKCSGSKTPKASPASQPVNTMPSDDQTKNNDTLPEGKWGGEHVSLEVMARSATLEFDCAHGGIDETVKLDRSGDFDIVGTFVPERGGPVTSDENAIVRPARYQGHVERNSLKLTVTLTDTNEGVGPFDLVHGRSARLFKCK